MCLCAVCVFVAPLLTTYLWNIYITTVCVCVCVFVCVS